MKYTKLVTAGVLVALSTAHAIAATCCGSTELAANQSCCNSVAYEPAADKVCCNNKGLYDPALKEGAVSFSLSGTDYFKGKLSAVLSKIPNVGSVTVSTAEGSFGTKLGDCCPSTGAPKIGGIQKRSGSVSIGFEISDVQIWPVPAVTNIQKSFTILGNNFKVMANFGLKFSSELSTNFTAGGYSNDCTNKSCGFAEGDIGFSMAFDAGAEAIGCYKLLFQKNEQCDEFSFSVLEISASGALKGSYNKDGDCTKGWSGEGSISSFAVKTKVTVGAGSATLTWYEFDGETI